MADIRQVASSLVTVMTTGQTDQASSQRQHQSVFVDEEDSREDGRSEVLSHDALSKSNGAFNKSSGESPYSDVVSDVHDQQPVTPPPDYPEEVEQKGPVSWSSLPHKGQLAILTIARLSEPLVQTSLQVSIPFPASI